MERDEQSTYFLYHPIVWIVTGARFFAAVLILISPLWGFLLTVLFDFLDAQIFIHLLGYSRSAYHMWDKVVDWFAYVTEFIVAISYGLYLPFFILLFWRFSGQFMFMKTNNTFQFIYFPNVFEAAFFWLILFHPEVKPMSVYELHSWVWLLLFLMLKIIHEISLHYIWPKYILPNVEEGWFWKKFFRRK